MKWPALLIAVLLAGCVTAKNMFVPMDSLHRQRTRLDHVVLLEQEPDWPYTVIGLITPPADRYRTMAEALNDARDVAADFGADAIIVDSAETQDVAVGRLNVFDRPTETLIHLRIRAIVRK